MGGSVLCVVSKFEGAYRKILAPRPTASSFFGSCFFLQLLLLLQLKMLYDKKNFQLENLLASSIEATVVICVHLTILNR